MKRRHSELNPEGERIKGLRVRCKLGDILRINGGEIRIQLVDVEGITACIAIEADREKFKVDRIKNRREKGLIDP